MHFRKAFNLQIIVMLGLFVLLFDMAMAGSSGSGGFSQSKKAMDWKSKNKNTNLEKSIGSARKHPLDHPTSFLKNGVYIWCDQDDVWTIYKKNRGENNFSVALKAKREIEILSSSGSVNISNSKDSNESILNFIDKTKNGVVQFKSNAESIQFTISSNRDMNMKLVYIGSLLDNPLQNPFELSKRTAPRSNDYQNKNNPSNLKLDISSVKESSSYRAGGKKLD